MTKTLSILILLVPMVCGVAACSSATTGSAAASKSAAAASNEAALRRSAEANAMVAQCALDRHLVKASSLPSSLGSRGKIKPGVGDTVAFFQWFQNVESMMVGGNYLYTWADWAMTYSKLPPAVCGSTSASELASSLFPGWPSVWNS